MLCLCMCLCCVCVCICVCDNLYVCVDVQQQVTAENRGQKVGELYLNLHTWQNMNTHINITIWWHLSITVDHLLCHLLLLLHLELVHLVHLVPGPPPCSSSFARLVCSVSLVYVFLPCSDGRSLFCRVSKNIPYHILIDHHIISYHTSHVITSIISIPMYHIMRMINVSL